MLTATIEGAEHNDAASLIDIIAPLINLLHGKPCAGGDLVGNNRPDYDQFVGEPHNQLWTYISCASESCNDSSDGCPFAGWPGYVIDEPASQARAMGWLSYEYRTTGQFYYDTTVTLPTAWTDQHFSGGNGDGNLFYPGIPDPQSRGLHGIPAIGGQDDIPIDSIRLKRIRDGMEDYEYLHFLATHGKGGSALSVARNLFPTMFKATRSQGAFDAARSQLISMIEAIVGP